MYDKSHLDRLSFVKRSRDLGFTLEQVRDLLRLADDLRGPCAEVDAITTSNVAEIDRKMADLQALRGGTGPASRLLHRGNDRRLS